MRFTVLLCAAVVNSVYPSYTSTRTDTRVLLTSIPLQYYPRYFAHYPLFPPTLYTFLYLSTILYTFLYNSTTLQLYLRLPLYYSIYNPPLPLPLIILPLINLHNICTPIICTRVPLLTICLIE